MWGRAVRLRVAALFALFFTSGCASPYFFHDPQLGWINSKDVPAIIKSIRCELITYYGANKARRKNFTDQLKAAGTVKDNYSIARQKYSFFNVDEGQYAMLYLDLKVVDAIGLNTGTAFDNKLVRSAESTRVFHIGPTLGDQSTYNFIWNYLIRQDAKLAIPFASAQADTGAAADDFTCYQNISFDPEKLAADDLPDGTAQFRRIWVNGQTPLAAWLLENNNTMGANFFAPTDAQATEQVVPAQALYSFAIQVSAGIESKISVTGLRWNPVAAGVGASSVQTSAFAFYINGPKAQAANGAKGGQSVITPKAPDPTHVIIDNWPRSQMSSEGGSAATPQKKDKTEKKSNKLNMGGKSRVPAYLNDNSRGHILYPLPINPPVPSQ